MEDKIFRSHPDAPDYPEYLLNEQLPKHRATIEEVRKFYQTAEKFGPGIVIPAKSQKTPPTDDSKCSKNNVESEHLNESEKK